ncbi:hypothetical protein Tco_0213368 [Tanacetum coccineum]
MKYEKRKITVVEVIIGDGNERKWAGIGWLEWAGIRRLEWVGIRRLEWLIKEKGRLDILPLTQQISQCLRTPQLAFLSKLFLLILVADHLRVMIPSITSFK